MVTSFPVPERTAIEAVRTLLSEQSGPVLVHADLVRVIGGVRGPGNRSGLLQAHADLVLAAADGRNVWMPAFNYSFTQTGEFHVQRDPSQVGVLTEHFRTACADWRSRVPVFSVSGSGPRPCLSTDYRIDPFGSDSAFSRLTEQDGTILLYGATLETFTFRHYVERLAGGPPYRYDKIFSGEIIDETEKCGIELLYHVRPLDGRTRYDNMRLASELTQQGLLKGAVLPRFSVMAVAASYLKEFWRGQLLRDPLHFLDKDSRQWVESRLQRLGRRFILSDFESPV